MKDIIEHCTNPE